MTTAELVVTYLRSLQERGERRLPIDEGARSILREWMLAARRGASRPAAVPQRVQTAPQASAPSAHPAQVPQAAEEIPQDAAAVANFLRSAVHEETPPDDDPGEEEHIPFFRPGGNNTEEVWSNFERLLPNWRPLRELGTLRSTYVPPSGNRKAAMMFVGDAPTYPDERERRTFAGAAGEKLDGMLKAMGLSRDEVYLTHLVKFRPAMARQTTNNRAPSEKEIQFSRSIVELEARLVQPRVIVALGVIAARGLLQAGELPLAAYQQMRGQFCGIPVLVTHHPSYLLRTNDLAERRRLWEEMLRAMEMCGLPINDKQRGYFLKK